MEKAVQAEAELFTNLEPVLADETRLRSNVRVTRGYLTKLESAVSEYEQAVTVLLTSLESDADQKAAYTDKLNEQLTLVDPVLNQLHDAVDSFKSAEDPPPEATNKAARSISSIKLNSRKVINSKIALV